MDAMQMLALAGPLSYFALTAAMFIIITKSLKQNTLASSGPVAMVYGTLAVFSFIHTFSCEYIYITLHA